MSKGPGKWMRLIMRALEAYPAFYLRDLIGPGRRDSMYSALDRAATQLSETGNVQCWTYEMGKRRAVITRPGEKPRRVNVDALHEALDGGALSVDGERIIDFPPHLEVDGPWTDQAGP